MPKGGFGNLIALPLQRGPRAEGFSVFVDAHACLDAKSGPLVTPFIARGGTRGMLSADKRGLSGVGREADEDAVSAAKIAVCKAASEYKAAAKK